MLVQQYMYNISVTTMFVELFLYSTRKVLEKCTMQCCIMILISDGQVDADGDAD